jgi:hypothetical protein
MELHAFARLLKRAPNVPCNQHRDGVHASKQGPGSLSFKKKLRSKTPQASRSPQGDHCEVVMAAKGKGLVTPSTFHFSQSQKPVTK